MSNYIDKSCRHVPLHTLMEWPKEDKVSEEKKQGVSGTREWSVASINCAKGCSNGCHYCFAREMAVRFGRVDGPVEWQRNVEIHRKPGKERKKYDGTVMFPTTHDITLETLQPSFEVLRNLLAAGNDVLIVSKPSLHCIEVLGRSLSKWMEHIQFRFSIGCLSGEISEMWEPYAPTIAERLACLHLARDLGYRTSVSMEPMLNPEVITEEFSFIASKVTETVWLGKVNHLRKRVVVQKRAILEDGSKPILQDGVPPKEINRLEAAQSDDNIWRIYNALKDEPKVRWKEDIKKVVGIPLETEAGTDR